VKTGQLTDTVIEYSFYLLIFFVPLIWLPANYELFEFNKITLTYILASVIFGAWLLKSADERKLYIKRTPLDIPITLFLIGNILATVVSMDRHTSFFGYYSRFNGGLLSTVTYIFLYYAFVTHFKKEKVTTFLLIGFVSSVLVAIYAVLQHPTPLFRNPDGTLRGIDAGYWAQNAQIRAFSTLGQPNWLAAYLTIFFFIGTSLLFIFKRFWQKFLMLVSLGLIFLGFTFAYSRAATLGLASGVSVFLFFFFVKKATFVDKIKTRLLFLSRQHFKVPKLGSNWVWLAGIVLVVLVVNFFYSNAFSKRGLAVEVNGTSITELDIEGKDTGQIRLLVWKGALEIFKDHPIFGSGVETFDYAYYFYRPVAHNVTSEWDFSYNKAHNEYLNYLATTGLVGTIPYLWMIGLFLYIAFRRVYEQDLSEKKLLLVTILSAYISYLVQNFFGFSVVIIAIIFYLAPGVFFILEDIDRGLWTIASEKFFPEHGAFGHYTQRGLILILTLALVLLTINSWIADFYFKKGISSTNATEVYNNLQTAVRLRPDEPLFISQLAVTEASLASKVRDKDFAKKLVADSMKYINKALSISPNIDTWLNKQKAMYNLISYDDKYITGATKTAEKVVSLAPTDAEIHYNLALFYLLENTKQGLKKADAQLVKVVSWRPKYLEARRQLARDYIKEGKKALAKEQIDEILKNYPNDPQTLDLLKSLKH